MSIDNKVSGNKVSLRKQAQVEYERDHPLLNTIRFYAEPGYTLRATNRLFPRGDYRRRVALPVAVFAEAVKLGLYGLVILSTLEALSK